MFGKRGQSNEGGLLIWIVVAIIAAIILVLFFNGGFQKIGSFFKAAPDTLEVAVQACNQVATPQFRTSYCDQWRSVTIGEEAQLINCQYLAAQNKLDISTPLDCYTATSGTTPVSPEAKGSEYCGVLFRQGKVDETTKVNGQVCKSLSCESAEFGGKKVLKTSVTDQTKACNTAFDAKEKALSKLIVKGYSESADYYCCVAP